MGQKESKKGEYLSEEESKQERTKSNCQKKNLQESRNSLEPRNSLHSIQLRFKQRAMKAYVSATS